MKNKTYRKIFLFVSYWAIGFLGIYLGYTLYRSYDFVARGISGIGLAILLYYFGVQSGMDAMSHEQLLLGHNKFRNILLMVIVSMLYWFAFVQIYQMVIVLFD